MVFTGISYTCRDGLHCKHSTRYGNRIKGVENDLVSQCNSDPNCVAYDWCGIVTGTGWCEKERNFGWTYQKI